MAMEALILHIEQGPLKGTSVDCSAYSPPSVTFGRVRQNDVHIRDPGTSQKHACVEWRSGLWMVVDLGSSNGTLLNDTLIPAHTRFPLHPHDTIKIGTNTTIRVDFPNPNNNNSSSKSKSKTPAKLRERDIVKAKAIDPQQAAPSSLQKPPPRGRSKRKAPTSPPRPASPENVRNVAAPPPSSLRKLGQGRSGGCGGGPLVPYHDKHITLRQWFVEMFVRVPQYIDEFAESLVNQMQQRSREFDEYARLQMKKA